MQLRPSWPRLACLAVGVALGMQGHALGAPSPGSRSSAPPKTGATTAALRGEAVTRIPPPSAATEAQLPPPPSMHELPRGGRSIFPRHRLVGFCGTPGAPALGRLSGRLPERAREIEALAQRYAGSRSVLPAFELI